MLLSECTGWAEMVINENSSNNNRIIFRGKFQEANIVNRNKRLYPYEVLNSNLERLAEEIQESGLTGELDHPNDSIVHLKDASHLITKLWWEGNVLMGEGRVLNTPSGKVLAELMKDGVRVGISSRGVGNGQINNEGVLVVAESYKLCTFDMVSSPSTPNAFQKRVVGSKNENYKPTVRTTTESVSRVNSDHLVTYFGCLLEQKKNEIKSKIK